MKSPIRRIGEVYPPRVYPCMWELELDVEGEGNSVAGVDAFGAADLGFEREEVGVGVFVGGNRGLPATLAEMHFHFDRAKAACLLPIFLPELPDIFLSTYAKYHESMPGYATTLERTLYFFFAAKDIIASRRATGGSCRNHL